MAEFKICVSRQVNVSPDSLTAVNPALNPLLGLSLVAALDNVAGAAAPNDAYDAIETALFPDAANILLNSSVTPWASLFNVVTKDKNFSFKVKRVFHRISATSQVGTGTPTVVSIMNMLQSGIYDASLNNPLFIQDPDVASIYTDPAPVFFPTSIYPESSTALFLDGSASDASAVTRKSRWSSLRLNEYLATIIELSTNGNTTRNPVAVGRALSFKASPLALDVLVAQLARIPLGGNAQLNSIGVFTSEYTIEIDDSTLSTNAATGNPVYVVSPITQILGDVYHSAVLTGSDITSMASSPSTFRPATGGFMLAKLPLGAATENSTLLSGTNQVRDAFSGAALGAVATVTSALIVRNTPNDWVSFI